MKKYCFSGDGELYDGEFDTREAALAEGRENFPGQAVWTAEVAPPLSARLSDNEVMDFIERRQDAAYDEVGELCREWLSEVTNAQGEGLRVRLESAFREWLTEHGLEPTWFSTAGDQKHAPE